MESQRISKEETNYGSQTAVLKGADLEEESTNQKTTYADPNEQAGKDRNMLIKKLKIGDKLIREEELKVYKVLQETDKVMLQYLKPLPQSTNHKGR